MSAPPNTPPSTQSGAVTPAKKPRKKHTPKHIPRNGGRPKGTRNIAWDAIRLVYVHGRMSKEGKPELPTYADLAMEFGVTMGAVALVGGREEWPKLRAEYQARMGAAIEKVSIEQTSQAIASVAAQSALTCGAILKHIKKIVTIEAPSGEIAQVSVDGVNRPSAVGAAVEARTLTPQDVEMAQGLSVVYRNLCAGTRLLVGGGQTTTQTPSVEVERDPPMSPEAQAAADLVVKAAASVNRAPTATTGTAPPGSGDGD